MTNPIATRGKVVKLFGCSDRVSLEEVDDGRTPNEGLFQTRRSEVIDANPSVTVTERQNASPWSSVVTYFLEAFALYALSYCGLPSAILKSGSEIGRAEPSEPKRKVPARERGRSIDLTTSSAIHEDVATKNESGADWTKLASAIPPEDAGICGRCPPIDSRLTLARCHERTLTVAGNGQNGLLRHLLRRIPAIRRRTASIAADEKERMQRDFTRTSL